MAIPAYINKLLDGIIEREGRTYENVKHDRGGPTKFGITLGRLRTERGKHITWEDVRDLTEDEARNIYYDAYFRRPGLEKLPEQIVPFALDFYVTSGTYAIKCLQNVLSDVGFDLTADGVIGPLTAEAAEAAQEAMGDDLLRAYIVERTHFFGRIVATRANQGKFLRGWVNQRSRTFWRNLGDA